MLRKIAFIALVAAALVCGTWGYFYLQDLKKPTLKPLDILPDSCSALIEIKDPQNFAQQLTQGNVMWEEMLKMGDVQKFNSVLLGLDSLCNSEAAREVLGSESFYIALYGKENHAIYAFDLSDVNEGGRATEYFEKNFAAKKLQPDFYECVFKSEKPYTFYLYNHAGLILASASKELVEKLAGESAKNTLSANKSFSESYKTAAKDKGIDVFIHFPYCRAGVWNTFFVNTNTLAGPEEKWIPVDVDIQPSDINLHGFLPTDSLTLSLAIKNQETHDLKDLYARLPYNTFMIEAVCVSDYGAFCRDNYRGDTLARRASLKKYSDSLAASAQTEINSFIGNTMARAKAVLGDEAHEIGIVDLSDEARARNFLRGVADSTIANNDTSNLFVLNDKKLFPLICADFFKTGFSYVSVINEMAVFCNSRRALAEYRATVNDKTNFTENERAMQFLEKDFSVDVNYLWYSDVYKNRDGIMSAFSPLMKKKLDEAPDLFEKFAAIGLSLQNLKEGIFYKAQASFNPRDKMYRGTLWETLADTVLYRIPDAVMNHKTGENEMVLQDINNTLYLLGSTGKILWKKNIHEKILGEVQQIDYFANGKLQMLFATESLIHLIDRNGNYVDGFPVKIKAGAAGGVSVFDYDGSKNYRIWLPLKNNTVICLNSACKAVDGFVPVTTRAPATRPIQHLVLQQKDYFILTDSMGNVYAVNRKGEPRLTFTNKTCGANDPIYLEAGKDATKTLLCFVDKDSKTLRKLSLTDKLETIPLETGEHIQHYFFDTLRPEGSLQVILESQDKMQAFDLFGKQGQVFKLKESCEAGANSMLFGDRQVYVCLGRETRTLHVTDVKTQKEIDNEIKLSSVPGSYNLIRSQGNYLVGFYRNKIFCIRP